MNWLFPLRSSPKWRFVLEILAAVVSDRVYDDPALEMRDWNPIETEAAANGAREAIHNATQGAVFHAGDGKYLFVCSTGDIGLMESHRSRLSFNGIEVPVEVNKDFNFRLIPHRVPHALMWYGIYGIIGEMGGFYRADEIDKCIFGCSWSR